MSVMRCKHEIEQGLIHALVLDEAAQLVNALAQLRILVLLLLNAPLQLCTTQLQRAGVITLRRDGSGICRCCRLLRLS